MSSECSTIPPPSKKRRLAVCALIIQDTKILAVSRRGESSSWGLPGGKVEKDEAPITALIREVREETGILLEKDHLEPCFTRIDDDFLVITYMYYGSITSTPVQGDAGPVAWVTWNDLLAGPFGKYNAKLKEALQL